MGKRIFKQYSQHQAYLLPPSLDELIEPNHPVRVVNQVIDSIDISALLKQYRGGGTTAYHPAMLIKVLIYSYLSNIYSSRRMETALKENIHLMWLSGMNRPDHNTLNRFRSARLKDTLKDIFVQIVQLLAQQGLLSLKEAYVDGTKIEADANRYTFIWGNAIKTNTDKIHKQLDELWAYTQKVASEEMHMPDPPPFDKADPEQLKQTIDKISQALKGKEGVDPKIKQKLGYASRNWPRALEKYQQQEQLLQGRNSCSKTDSDATFMRMKEDHMQNGQLKPGYNLQLSTHNQYITHYSLHQSPTDTNTLIAHLEQQQDCYGVKLESVIADGGYGSEQNYQYLEDKGIASYVKYNYFDKDQQGMSYKKHPFASATLYYNREQDCYYCPMGQKMGLVGTDTRTTVTGYKQHIRGYAAINCQGCPLRGACHKGQGNRIIEVNHNLNRLKQGAVERLSSEQGIYYRKRRCCDVEPVFGNIKGNHAFRRFMLRGIEKVRIEAGLLALAHNLRKKAA